MLPTQNLHVKEAVRLLTPRALKAELPATEAANHSVVAGRQRVTRILTQQDPRLLVVVGPCSIHDIEGALDYGTRLAALRKRSEEHTSELQSHVNLVCRLLLEKKK